MAQSLERFCNVWIYKSYWLIYKNYIDPIFILPDRIDYYLTYHAGIMPILLCTYYAQNYATIIDSSLTTTS